MFGKDKKANQVPSGEDNSEMEIYLLEAKYSSSARTRAVQKNVETTTYRRAEKMENGSWRVLEVDIFDYSEVYKKAAASLNAEGVIAKERRISTEIRLIEQTSKGEKIKDFPFAEAMRLLANLEYDVLKGDLGYTYKELDDKQDKAGFVDLGEASGFTQTDFYDVEHFVTVSEREGLVWAEDATPKLTKNGRLVEPGIYMVADVTRANETASATENEKDPKLAKAFKTVANRQNVKDMMVAMSVINDMNEFFAEFEKLVNSYGYIVESPDLHSDLGIKENLRNCREICEDINERAGLYVERYQTILDRIELSVNALKMDDMMSQLRNDPSLVKALNDDVDAAQKRTDELMERIGLNKNYETIMDMAVGMEFLNAEIAEYKKNRDAFTKKIAENPSAAVEQKAGFADKPNVKRNKAPKK